jgi:hypothetical protein
MKRIVALVLLAALGFGVAGCAATKKTIIKKGGSVSIYLFTTTQTVSGRSGTGVGSGYTINSGVAGTTIIVTGKATIPHVRPGTRVRCKGGRSMRVTKNLHGLNGSPSGAYDVIEGGGSSSGSTRSTSIELRHFPNGTVTVTCK